MKQCFVDMDGVIADFVSAISRAHNRPSPYTDPRTLGISLGLFDMEKIWGITAKEFWVPSNSHEFWATIEKTPDADAIINLAESQFGSENVAILTAPSQAEGCISGKREWIKHHYPQFKQRIIFASAKEFLAGPDKFLIDDRDKNIDAFRGAGGTGILVSRLWNQCHNLSDNSFIWLEADLLWELNN